MMLTSQRFLLGCDGTAGPLCFEPALQALESLRAILGSSSDPDGNTTITALGSDAMLVEDTRVEQGDGDRAMRLLERATSEAAVAKAKADTANAAIEATHYSLTV